MFAENGADAPTRTRPELLGGLGAFMYVDPGDQVSLVWFWFWDGARYDGGRAEAAVHAANVNANEFDGRRPLRARRDSAALRVCMMNRPHAISRAFSWVSQPNI